MADRQTAERLLPWAARLAWIGVLLAGSESLDEVLADTSDTRRTVLQLVALIVWVGGVAAMAVPSVWSLTATRVLIPTAIPVAVTVWAAGAPSAIGATFLGVSILTTVVVGAAEYGRAFVQASAYGAEDRHPLRAPLAYLAVAAVAWALWVACGLVAAIVATDGAWWLALGLGVLAAAGLALGLPRWHRLSRRWLVLVPIGLVVHDDLVLAETLMLRRQQLDRIGLAPAATEAADLTGPASGHAIEIRTSESVTAVLTPTAKRGAPKALHLTGCLITPTRPGRALSAAAERRLPVGPIG